MEENNQQPIEQLVAEPVVKPTPAPGTEYPKTETPMTVPPKKNKGKVALIAGLIGILLFACIYMLLGNKFKKDDTSDNTTTTTTTTVQAVKPAELENAKLTVFYDVGNNQKLYLAEFVGEANGDNYNPTTHEVYDASYKKVASIPELKYSHIFTKNGESLFGANVAKEITARLENNKIFSLAVNPDNECEFVEYETYFDSGVINQKVIRNISSSDVQVTGVKC